MNVFLEELSRSLPDAHEAAQVTIRLLAALIAGASSACSASTLMHPRACARTCS